MKRTEITRTAMKRSRPKVEAMSREREAWLEEGRRQGACAVTGWSSRVAPYHVHHVIYEQELKRRWGAAYNAAKKYDVRNALRVATVVHGQHHTAHKRIPLTALRQQNIDYAFELLGAYAYDYLTTHYRGHDERVELAFAEAQRAQ